MHSDHFNEHYRFGSAGWADESALCAAGLFDQPGLPVGFHGGRRLWLEGDAPLITFGGAGTGKLTTVIGHIMCTVKDRSMVVLDPRGEIAATFLPALAHHGIEAFLWNPYRLHGLPSHRCNPLDPIDPRLPTFHADCKLAARSLITVTSKGEGKYFEQRGSGWVEAKLKYIAAVKGSVTFADLMYVVNIIESGTKAWPDFLKGMTQSAFADVRRAAGEMITKQQDGQREFGSIMGETYSGLSALDDPALQHALEEPDFSLEAVCASDRPTIVFLMMPAEYLHQSAAVLRQFLTACRLYKSRNPGGRRLLMVIDEAAQLGHFPALQELYTYGRGIGIQPWTFWQDIGQVENNFGRSGVDTFLGSSQMRQFLGARDYRTARLISDMLGTETLEYDDPRLQGEAQRQKRLALQRVWQGEDILPAAMEVAHYSRAAKMRTKQGRKLMAEDEVLGLAGDKHVLFISGDEPIAVLADRQAYFRRREFAGLYLPNPYHPPFDSVEIATRWGSKRARVIREPVPEKFSSFAQYQMGTWAYVEGYKPT